MKWREKPFPWFHDILLISGETISTGSHRWSRGTRGGDNQERFTKPREEQDTVDLSLLSTTSSGASSDTPIQGESEDEKEKGPGRFGTKKRRADARKAAEKSPLKKKRKKVSGIDAIDRMNDSIRAVADALSQPGPIRDRDTVNSEIVRQAQDRVQDLEYLTEDGVAVIMERLSDPVRARTYMGCKKEGVRRNWLTRQLKEYDGDLSTLFTDLENGQQGGSS